MRNTQVAVTLQRYASASGLNYNYFRNYEAETGRYTRPDPIGLKGGTSLYAYAQPAPTSYSDESGLAHTAGFSSWQLETQGMLALAEARQGIAKCQMGECYDGLEPYHMRRIGEPF